MKLCLTNNNIPCNAINFFTWNNDFDNKTTTCNYIILKYIFMYPVSIHEVYIYKISYNATNCFKPSPYSYPQILYLVSIHEILLTRFRSMQPIFHL